MVPTALSAGCTGRSPFGQKIVADHQPATRNQLAGGLLEEACWIARMDKRFDGVGSLEGTKGRQVQVIRQDEAAARLQTQAARALFGQLTLHRAVGHPGNAQAPVIGQPGGCAAHTTAKVEGFIERQVSCLNGG